jgi:phosphoribosylformylglycinamidine cyclo-ligase
VNNLDQEFAGSNLGEVLLTPTKIYVKPVLALLEQVKINGMAHITGGGLYENVPRIIPDGLCANIDTSLMPKLAIFDFIQSQGIAPKEMYGTFNMGFGFILVLPPEQAQLALTVLAEHGEIAHIVGEISQGNEKICLKL